jgi:ABC-type enterobactin transport system permease subunit
MAAGWKLTPQKKARLALVARLRWMDPGDADLARELGVSIRAVQYHLNRLRVSVTYLPQGAVIPLSWMVESQHDGDAVADDPAPDGA